MVGFTPEEYELVRLAVHLASCLSTLIIVAAVESGTPFVRRHNYLSLGLPYGEAKRRALAHDHLHHLPQLLGSGDRETTPT